MEGRNLDAAFPLQEFLHSRTDFIGTVAPRLGLAWDRVLLYAKGGVAWAHDDYWLTGVQAHVGMSRALLKMANDAAIDDATLPSLFQQECSCLMFPDSA
jgi:hypothetical protein